jgi:hypothetical protein
MGWWPIVQIESEGGRIEIDAGGGAAGLVVTKMRRSTLYTVAVYAVALGIIWYLARGIAPA